MNVEKQIQYWIDATNENVDVAEYLINGKKTVDCLFFSHLALETILKAHLTKFTKQTPPKIHNLISIADKANIELDAQTKLLKTIFDVTKQKIKWLKEKL